MRKKSGEVCRRVMVSAPGKVILSGEHSVVYGYPAILTAVDRRLSVSLSSGGKNLEVASRFSPVKYAEYGLRKAAELIGEDIAGIKVEIDSQIPIGSGMGSSAALAVALTAGLFNIKDQPWNLKRINKIAYEIEKKQHGRPSGGDNTIVTHGGFLEFRRGADGSPNFRHLFVEERVHGLFLLNSGKPEETTGEMVSMVGDLYENNRNRIEDIFKRIGEVTLSFSRYLEGETEVDVGRLIRENQRLLELLDVVSPSTKEIVRKIERMGGAAKISGAGGRKADSGILLTYHSDPEKLLHLAKSENWDMFRVNLGEEGVRIEEGR